MRQITLLTLSSEENALDGGSEGEGGGGGGMLTQLFSRHQISTRLEVSWQIFAQVSPGRREHARSTPTLPRWFSPLCT
jgi:hypothetical protein